jgi:LysM repeat protein
MRDVRQVFWGIITGLISIALVLGVLSLSLVEGNMLQATVTTQPIITLARTITQRSPTIQPQVITVTWQPTSSLVDSATPAPPTLISSSTPSVTPTYPIPTGPARTTVPCGAPRTWVVYIVQPGDTLYHLGQAYGIPYTEIQKANCLTGTTLRVGQHLYVPPWATRTPSPAFPGYVILTDTPISTWPALVETNTPTPTETVTLFVPTTETPSITP